MWFGIWTSLSKSQPKSESLLKNINHKLYHINLKVEKPNPKYKECHQGGENKQKLRAPLFLLLALPSLYLKKNRPHSP